MFGLQGGAINCVLHEDAETYFLTRLTQPTISLTDFYTALRNQQVEEVEFDGAMYEVNLESGICFINA